MTAIKALRLLPSGFTLIELLVTIAITAILATIAVPSFSNLITMQRAKTVSAELFETLLETRSEAIKRNADITMTCNPGGCVNGWNILDPANVGQAIDSRGAAAGVTITGPNSLVFRPSGRVLGTTPPMFLITATSGTSVMVECISVDLTGRPYLVAASTC